MKKNKMAITAYLDTVLGSPGCARPGRCDAQNGMALKNYKNSPVAWPLLRLRTHTPYFKTRTFDMRCRRPHASPGEAGVRIRLCDKRQFFGHTLNIEAFMG
jgi:hypothetical protein